MKIALINENSQADKNALIFETLKKVAEPLGHVCYNYGRYSAEDPQERTYVQAGLLSAILLNSHAADFVITGCGTGMGAMLACNAFPGVMCGRVNNPCDAYLFSQVNNGNAISIPYSYQFGWGAEINLEYIFEKLFSCSPGGGYPEEWAPAEQRNRSILIHMKEISHSDIMYVLKNIDRDFLLETISTPGFKNQFFDNCQVKEIGDFIGRLTDWSVI